MPVVTEKYLRHLKKKAESGSKAEAKLKAALADLAPTLAEGVESYQLPKAEGVTEEQHQHYLDQLKLIAFDLKTLGMQ